MRALDEHDAVVGILTTASFVAQREAAIARYWDPSRVFVAALESDLSDDVDGMTRAIEGLTYGCDDECDPNIERSCKYTTWRGTLPGRTSTTSGPRCRTLCRDCRVPVPLPVCPHSDDKCDLHPRGEDLA
eukprot:Polyplicarium_translucidae@DN746_c0_g1_i1.p2